MSHPGILNRLALAAIVAVTVAACATPPQPQTGGYANATPGLTTTYAVTLRNFSTREIMAITGTMEREFPYYVTSRAPVGDTAVMRYGYVSQAPAHKLYDWVNVMLMNMGLDPDRRVKVIVNQTAIDIDKIY